MGTKISALPTGTVASTDVLPVVKAGVTTGVQFGHTHPESEITNLVSDLAGKASSSHTHPESDITNLVSDLAGKAASTHTHSESDVTNLTTDLSSLDSRLDHVEFLLGSLGSLDVSTWGWVNQGSSSLTVSNGVGSFAKVSTASTSVAGMFATAPITPYTVTIKASFRIPVANFSTIGIALRESGSGKICIIGFSWNTSFKMNLAKFTGATTFNSDTLTGQLVVISPIYLRVANNGTNVIYSWSMDGQTFQNHVSELKNNFFTAGPDQYGIAGDNSSGDTCYMGIHGITVA